MLTVCIHSCVSWRGVVRAVQIEPKKLQLPLVLNAVVLRWRSISLHRPAAQACNGCC